jgi:hypothetical protein
MVCVWERWVEERVGVCCFKWHGRGKPYQVSVSFFIAVTKYVR